MRKEKGKQQIQYIIVTLDDGSKHYFSGVAICFPGEKRNISDIQFSIPQDLPDDMSFEILDGKNLI